MTNKIHIGWCPLTKIPELQQLLDTYWRKGHILARDAQFLQWQHRHLTSSDHLSILIAHDEQQQIVGCLGLIQVPFNDYGTPRTALWMTTWLVIPEGRGRGIGFALLDYVMQAGTEIIQCIGFNDLTHQLVLRAGFKVEDRVPRWVQPIALDTLKAILLTREIPYSETLQARWQKVSAPPTALTGLKIQAWSAEIAPHWNEFWHTQVAPHYLMTAHTSDYLEWRYLQHPIFQYQVRVALDTNGLPQGLLVYRLNQLLNRTEQVLQIVDLLGGGAAKESLLQNVILIGTQQQVAFIEFYCTDLGLSSHLEQAGFYRDDLEEEINQLPTRFQPLDFRTSPFRITYWVNPALHPQNHEFFKDDHLYFTRSDGDQDRPN